MMSPTTRHRWSVASRALAAIVGGYGLVSLLTIAASLLLPLAGIARSSALLGTTIASFLVWTAIIMAVFHTRSAALAWARLIGAAIPLGLLVGWLLSRAQG